MTVEILPASGIITLSALAEYLHTDTTSLQQSLTDKGIPVLKLSTRANKKLIRLEDLRADMASR